MINNFNSFKINEYGPPRVVSELEKFVNAFIEGVDNPFIMSMFFRMLDTNSFVKMGKEIYNFSEEEKQKLEVIKPKLFDLVDRVAEIKKLV